MNKIVCGPFVVTINTDFKLDGESENKSNIKSDTLEFNLLSVFTPV